MKYSELIREVKSFGCFLKRHGSNHDVYQSPITGKLFTIPRHHSEEVPKGTLNSIRKTAGIKNFTNDK